MRKMYTSTKTKRSGRALLVVVAAATTMGLAVAVVPRILERLLIHQLTQSGIEAPSLRLARLSPRSLQIQNVNLQHGRIRLARLDLAFSPREILRGRIDHIRVEGLEWTLHARDGGLDPGLPSRPPGDDPSLLPELQTIPFSRIGVVSSFLVIEHNGIALRIPFSGRVETIDPQQIHWESTAHVAGIGMQLDGEANLKSGWLHASAQSPDLAGGNARMDLRMRVDPRGNLQDADLALSAETLMGPGFSIPRLQAELSGMGRSLSALIDVAKPVESKLRLQGSLLQTSDTVSAGVRSWEYEWQLQGTLPVNSLTDILRMDDPLPENIESHFKGSVRLTLGPEDDWEMIWNVVHSRLGEESDDDALTPLLQGLLNGERTNLAGPIAKGNLNHDGFRLTGTWPLFDSSPLTFDLFLPRSLQADVVSLHVDQDWIPLPDNQVLHQMAPELGDADLTGEVRFQMRGDTRTGRFRPIPVIDLRQISFSSEQLAMRVDGVSGRIEFDRLSPLSTPGNQRLAIDSLRAGDLEAGPGQVTFRLEDPQTLLVEGTTWQLPSEGTVAIQGARLDLKTHQSRFDVQLDRVDLIALLKTLTDGKIGGSGLFYGRIPLTLDGHRIRPGNGYLYSVPGTGRLQIHDKEWLSILMLYLNEALSSHPYLSVATARMEEALHDLEYNYLTIDLTKDAGGSSARIELRGKGVTGDPPQEIAALILNLEGLDYLIDHALNLRQTHANTIDQALEDWLDF